eukprot:1151562-Prymnesium_polylepis.1
MITLHDSTHDLRIDDESDPQKCGARPPHCTLSCLPSELRGSHVWHVGCDLAATAHGARGYATSSFPVGADRLLPGAAHDVISVSLDEY